SPCGQHEDPLLDAQWLHACPQAPGEGALLPPQAPGQRRAAHRDGACAPGAAARRHRPARRAASPALAPARRRRPARLTLISSFATQGVVFTARVLIPWCVRIRQTSPLDLAAVRRQLSEMLEAGKAAEAIELVIGLLAQMRDRNTQLELE